MLTIEMADEVYADLERCERITLVKKSVLVANMLRAYTNRIIQKDLNDVQKILKPRHASTSVDSMKEAIKQEGEKLRKDVYAGI
jgi:hypothetical protein